MEAVFNKKILAVLLQWDYGIRERGDSLDKNCFLVNLQKLVSEVDVFWYDEYLKDIPTLQDKLLSRAVAFKPDLVFFIMFTDQFTKKTLLDLKLIAPTFAWFCDDRWRFDNYTKHYAPFFSFVSTTDPFSIPKYQTIGVKPILSQWAGQPYSALKGPLGSEDRFQYDISFIGQCNSTRKWFVKELNKTGINVACFGSNWPNGRVSFVQMEEIFRKSRINLNLSNSVSNDVRFVFGGLRNFKDFLQLKKRVETEKARNFEIPLAGGFQLCQFFPGLERYFKIGEEVVAYASVDDCIVHIKYFLGNEEARKKIAWSGFERARNEHTYIHRLSNVLNEIFNVRNKERSERVQ